MKHLRYNRVISCLMLSTRPMPSFSLVLPSSRETIKGTRVSRRPRKTRIQSLPMLPCESRIDRVCWNLAQRQRRPRKTLGVPSTASVPRRYLGQREQQVGRLFRRIFGFSPLKIAVAIITVMLGLCARCAPAMALSAVDANVGRSIVSRQVQVQVESAFRVVVASLLGSLLGFQRFSAPRNGGQSTGAGMRTMALVSLGACVFCMCGTHGFAVHCATESFPGMEYASVDSSRMASNVATGVGFIGAGVITNNRSPDGTYDLESAVRGLTTAATIWMSAAVGAAAGAGMYFAASQFVILCLVVLRLGEWMEHTKDEGPKKMKSGPREGTDEGISEVKNVPPSIQLSELNAEPELQTKSWTESLDANITVVEELGPAQSNTLAVELANSTQTEDENIENDNELESKSVDPLVEKFLQRGGTVASKSASGEDLGFAEANHTDSDDDSDSQQIIR